MSRNMDLRIHKGLEGLSREAARIFRELAGERVNETGLFTVALSGGSTPANLYSILSSAPYDKKIPWNGVHLFFGDERCVEPAHPDSNYRMVSDTLISAIEIPGENIHRMEGELDPVVAARRYEEEIRRFFSENSLLDEGSGRPVFDLVLLGLGEDGHTLSLFPSTRALDEGERLVAENHVERLKGWRLTLTLPVVNAASTVVFLVSGEGKARALKEVADGALSPAELPALGVRPLKGSVIWLVDEAAARLVS